jgi:predicted branched-subunit amino acid permease
MTQLPVTPTVVPHAAPVAAPSVTFTAAGLRRGAHLSLPFCVSSIVYGVAFGLLATGVGVSKLAAVLMSATVFSGSAQIAVLQSWTEHPALLTVFVTVLVANVRYVLMGAALRAWLAPLGLVKTTLILLPLVDGSFALAFRERERGDHDAGVLLGSSLVSFTGWVVGTAIGVSAGQWIADPRAIGLDFIIVGFCAASAAMMLRARADVWPALAAALAVISCERWAPGPWTIVVAALAAAVVGAVRYRAPVPLQVEPTLVAPPPVKRAP